MSSLIVCYLYYRLHTIKLDSPKSRLFKINFENIFTVFMTGEDFKMTCSKIITIIIKKLFEKAVTFFHL